MKLEGNVSRRDYTEIKVRLEQELEQLCVLTRQDVYKMEWEKRADITDVASDEMLNAELFALKKRDLVYKNNIKEALRRINTGTYGICHECDCEIDIQRLSVVPVASLCISCQDKLEMENSKCL